MIIIIITTANNTTTVHLIIVGGVSWRCFTLVLILSRGMFEVNRGWAQFCRWKHPHRFFWHIWSIFTRAMFAYVAAVVKKRSATVGCCPKKPGFRYFAPWSDQSPSPRAGGWK